MRIHRAPHRCHEDTAVPRVGAWQHPRGDHTSVRMQGQGCWPPGGAHSGPRVGGARLLPLWVRGACAGEQSEGPTHLLPPSLLQPGSESTSSPPSRSVVQGWHGGKGMGPPRRPQGLGKPGRRTRHGD